MRDFHTRQLENTKLEAQMQQRAMLHALGIEAQGATLDIQRELQLALRELDQQFTANQSALNRAHQKEIEAARTRTQKESINKNYDIAMKNLAYTKMRDERAIKFEIEKTKFAAQQNTMPSFNVTASTVSPGESGMNPASYHAWS